MSAAEWLDAVRADLGEATPGPWRTEWDDADKWHSITGAGHGLGGGLWVVCPEVATVEAGGDADANLIASAPDRLDRMERALRGVLDLAEAVNAAAIIPTSTPIMNAGYRAALGDVVTAIKEVLGDDRPRD